MKTILKVYTSLLIVVSIGLVTYLSPALLYTSPVKVSAEPVKTNATSSVLPSIDVLSGTNILVQKCTGDWMYIDSVGIKIDLSYETISSWNFRSNPSILKETLNYKNTVLLGHNYCEGGDCYKPTTDFGQIINVVQGDKASACINGSLYSGEILVSKQIDETATYILDDWLNQPTVTAFTCYGECKDANCNAVKSRWVIAFNKF